jgi:hypothetical protein
VDATMHGAVSGEGSAFACDFGHTDPDGTGGPFEHAVFMTFILMLVRT